MARVQTRRETRLTAGVGNLAACGGSSVIFLLAALSDKQGCSNKDGKQKDDTIQTRTPSTTLTKDIADVEPFTQTLSIVHVLRINGSYFTPCIE
jgi:hypothetical protein